MIEPVRDPELLKEVEASRLGDLAESALVNWVPGAGCLMFGDGSRTGRGTVTFDAFATGHECDYEVSRTTHPDPKRVVNSPVGVLMVRVDGQPWLSGRITSEHFLYDPGTGREVYTMLVFLPGKAEASE